MDGAKVPENLGRKMAFGVYTIHDIGVFSFWLILFIGIGLITGQLYIGLIGLIVAYLIAFYKIDGLDFIPYLRLKFREVNPHIGTLKMYMGDTLFNGKRYFMVLETAGVNYSFMTEEDRMGLLYKYETMLNACDFPLQMVVHTEKFDYSPFLDLVSQDSESAKGYKELIKKACEGLYLQRYFIVIGADYYEIQGDIKNEGIRAKIARDLLLKRINIVAEGLNNMGLPFEILRGNELMEILKEELS